MSDDRTLWQRFTQDIIPLNDPKHRPKAPPEEVEIKTELPKLPSKSRELLSSLLPSKKNQKTLPPLHVGDHANIDAATLRRLKSGAIDIDARLDLHGYTLVQAHQKLEAFIHTAYQRQCKYLLVITGKGKENKGQIRNTIMSWLNLPTVRDKIITTQFAHIRHGGAGALYIVLKKKRP